MFTDMAEFHLPLSRLEIDILPRKVFFFFKILEPFNSDLYLDKYTFQFHHARSECWIHSGGAARLLTVTFPAPDLALSSCSAGTVFLKGKRISQQGRHN